MCTLHRLFLRRSILPTGSLATLHSRANSPMGALVCPKGTPLSMTTFASFGVPTALAEVLSAQGKTEPFPIQADTLPDTLAGRDVLGRGKTGSGKTLAFSIPMVARLAEGSTGRRRPGRPRGLILSPTRELATQIAATIEPLAAAYSMKVTTIFGGVSQNRQVAALSAGVDIVVACPGRLEDLMKQHYVSLENVQITVLDEADHMADLGFLPGVTRILSATPAKGQRLLFSATLDNGVDKLVKRFLTDQVTHSVDEATSPVAAMTHNVFEVDGVETKKKLVHTLASGTGRRILFMRTKHQARKLAKQLTEAGIPSVDLHGNLSQAARDRNLLAFSSGDAKVLVATDVAARGVHVDDVALVVHVDPPAEHKAYLHRSGRTARAGSAGDVVTVVLPEQRKDTAVLLRKADIKVTPIRVTADSPEVARLVGEQAAYVAPAPKAATQQPRQAKPRNGSGRSSNPRSTAARGGGNSRSASGNPRAGAGATAAGADGRQHAAGGGRRRRRPAGPAASQRTR
ncbi:DEAD/DEAH box helicase [Rhodococcus sp. BP-252]|nr:DEAD/DEAH box helicase [Rhodococcus sp. BP-320]MBY6417720.1 DEAD/DEAH box helicase [Rhodococcus sp. BP-321]MBY6423256.1 DEAD/DEAH box helicase [Rhodococcus sp. BP-324]MBY6427859.1 DEAD/DEAH box helicase [Rhodococcus sp. BP-323]MBY6431858.1 DEAD/DEAH box helicase [Rhodococcus sp. BP-322]MBY6441966.1 DEAD/DEAH box helicase [Rhodococcus sp. BP-319]MBY6446834.1 DEAD/DEAH box helicase [Rhodococcus sp. BP-318]MBY6451632.1 DEAD/DEAH box helicase [Rhodococcus sp. BP-315]MBY6456409.1 DEAD/DEAH bo